jgi:hypothetical protein
MLITYDNHKKGRSGHILYDLTATLTFEAAFAGASAAWSPGWEKQQIIPAENARALLPAPPDIEPTRFKYKQDFWRGIPYRLFKIIRSAVPNSDVIQLEGTLRFPLLELYAFELKGRVPQGAFQSALDKLRRLYWHNNNDSVTENRVAIHVRRGDRGTRPIEGHINNTAYIQKVVNSMHVIAPAGDVVLYTEKDGSGDLDRITGASIIRGDADDLHQHVRDMVNAEYFIPTASGLSVNIMYLRRAKTLLFPHSVIRKQLGRVTLLPTTYIVNEYNELVQRDPVRALLRYSKRWH